MQTIRLIEECVIESFKRAVFKEDDKSIAKALLTHPEQRFRLSYILGQYKTNQRERQVDGNEEPYPDTKRLFAELESLITKIKDLAVEAQQVCPPENNNLDEVVELLYEDFLRDESEEFAEIVNSITNTIKLRFQILNSGKYKFDNRGWPIYWKLETENKDELIEQMRWFAGNDGRRFGQLLAPLVNGIRIKANFRPSWLEDDRNLKLIILDGEGIGRDSNIATSVPINVTNKYQDVDVIAVVDNATQPMLNIPKVIISDVANRGYFNRLAVLYTRFEQVQGPCLIDDEDRRGHVLAIQNGAIDSFESQGMNSKVVRQIREHLNQKTYFLPKANDLKTPEDYLVEQMENFLSFCSEIIIEA